MTRLVIHIGDCKAGSTAIQSVLRQGSYETSVERPLYAESGRRGALNHHPLSNALFMKEASKWRDRAWSSLSEEVRNSGRTTVISSERFEFADPLILRDVLVESLPEVDVKLVAYIRPHLERVVSGYVQNVKQGLFDGELDAFLGQLHRTGRFQFAPRLVQWRKVFGDALHVRPMVRAELAGSCVATDFLSFVCEAPVEVTKIASSNPSLSAPALALVRALWRELGTNRAGNSPQVKALNSFAAALETSDPYRAEKVMMSRKQAQRAANIFASDAVRCDSEFFGHSVLCDANSRYLDDAPDIVQELAAPPDAVEISRIWLMTSRAKRPDGNPHATAAQWAALR